MQQGVWLLARERWRAEPRSLTAFIWALAAGGFALTFVIATIPPSRALAPLVPDQFEGYFNLFGLLFWPWVAAIECLAALLFWTVKRWLPYRPLRALGVAAVLLLMLAIPVALFSGVEDLATAIASLVLPGVLLPYTAPLTVCAIYTAFAHRPTFLRVLGVMALASVGGLLLFVTGWSLLCGETD